MHHGLRKFLAISALFVPASAQAHSGPHRGDMLWSLIHAVTQIDHLAAMAAVGVGTALAGAVAWRFAAGKTRASAR